MLWNCFENLISCSFRNKRPHHVRAHNSSQSWIWSHAAISVVAPPPCIDHAPHYTCSPSCYSCMSLFMFVSVMSVCSEHLPLQTLHPHRWLRPFYGKGWPLPQKSTNWFTKQRLMGIGQIYVWSPETLVMRKPYTVDDDYTDFIHLAGVTHLWCGHMMSHPVVAQVFI